MRRKIRVGINGFGRIGRHAFKIGHRRWDIVAINDLPLPINTFAHLLKYDSLMGEFPEKVRVSGKYILAARQKTRIFSYSRPEEIPWAHYGADVVIEAVGLFTQKSDAMGHLQGGAKKVVVTAPSGDEDLTIIMGLNDHAYKPGRHHIVSAGSCTANCLAPVLSILMHKWGVERAFMTTTHCYTQNQRIIDAPHKDLRRSRMAGINMIPTETTSIEPVIKVLPEMRGKLKGIAIRVPIPNVSLIELLADMKRNVTIPVLNRTLKAECQKNKVMKYTEVPLVSSDFMHSPCSATVAGDLTDVVGGRMAHVIAWYNNEWGYANRVADIVDLLGKKGL